MKISLNIVQKYAVEICKRCFTSRNVSALFLSMCLNSFHDFSFFIGGKQVWYLKLRNRVNCNHDSDIGRFDLISTKKHVLKNFIVTSPVFSIILISSRNVSSLIWRSVNRKATCLYSEPAIFNTFFKSLRQLDTL